MNNNRDLFENAPVPKAVAVMAVPTMISMLVVVIYNMADTFFIGQTGDPMQVAAVSLATPVFMVFMGTANAADCRPLFQQELGFHVPNLGQQQTKSFQRVPHGL